MARYKNKGPPRRSHKGKCRGHGESFSASRRFASMSWHKALLIVRLRPGDCPGMALGGGERYRISVPFLSMFIRYRIILTTI